MQNLQSRLNILYIAFLSSSLVYVIVGFALVKSGWKPLLPMGAISQALFGVFVLISLFCVVAAFQIRKKQSEETEKNAFSKSVVVLALSEVPSILGLVSFLVTGGFASLLILWFISLAAFILFKPATTS
jgi:hypothetical protein